MRYEHSCNETWKNGQLVAFQSRTNDNGTKHAIDVTAAPDKLSMDADEHGKHSDLPKTAAPASLWAKDAIHQFDAFDPDTGKRMAIKVTDLGEEVLALHRVSRSDPSLQDRRYADRRIRSRPLVRRRCARAD